MSGRRELQVQIDDVYACPGSCPGCMLSIAERRRGGADMPVEVLDQVMARLQRYACSLPRLDRCNLTFGLADHLSLGPEAILDLHRRAAALIEAVDPRDRTESAVFISMAMIGRTERLEPMLRRIADETRRAAVRLIPLVVLDPVLVDRPGYGPAYADLIARSRDWFGQIDLSLNLSLPVAERFSPQRIWDFACGHGFAELTVNWVPTPGNAGATLADPERLAEWLIGLDRLAAAEPGRLGLSYRDPLLRIAAEVMAERRAGGGPGPLPIAEIIRSRVAETAARTLHVDPTGQVMVRFEAIGDVAQDPRFGFAPLGSLMEQELGEILEAAQPRLAARALAAMLRHPGCRSCNVADLCAATGFMIFNQVARAAHPQRRGCPHLARPLLQHYAAGSLSVLREPIAAFDPSQKRDRTLGEARVPDPVLSC